MSGTVMQTTKGTRKTKYVIKITKGVGNVSNNMAVQGTRAHTANMPQVMTIVGLSSMANVMNPVIPWSIAVQRNDDFTVKVDHAVMSIEAPTHQNIYVFCHLWHFILVWSLLCIMCLLIPMSLSGDSI